MSSLDYDRLAAALVDELEDRGLVGDGDELLTVEQGAERAGVTTPTVYRRRTRTGRPTRDGGRRPKSGGSTTTMISWTEWSLGEEVPTRAVRESAGLSHNTV